MAENREQLERRVSGWRRDGSDLGHYIRSEEGLCRACRLRIPTSKEISEAAKTAAHGLGRKTLLGRPAKKVSRRVYVTRDSEVESLLTSRPVQVS